MSPSTDRLIGLCRACAPRARRIRGPPTSPSSKASAKRSQRAACTHQSFRTSERCLRAGPRQSGRPSHPKDDARRIVGFLLVLETSAPLSLEPCYSLSRFTQCHAERSTQYEVPQGWATWTRSTIVADTQSHTWTTMARLSICTMDRPSVGSTKSMCMPTAGAISDGYRTDGSSIEPAIAHSSRMRRGAVLPNPRVLLDRHAPTELRAVCAARGRKSQNAPLVLFRGPLRPASATSTNSELGLVSVVFQRRSPSLFVGAGAWYV
jgi:hypothetical protein